MIATEKRRRLLRRACPLSTLLWFAMVMTPQTKAFTLTRTLIPPSQPCIVQYPNTPLRIHGLPFQSSRKTRIARRPSLHGGRLWAQQRQGGDEEGTNLISSDASSAASAVSALLLPTEPLLRPAGEALDELTNGYALVYADLFPETPATPLGQAFLASNIVYAIVGLALTLHGDVFLGSLTEIVSVASFVYHYTQLDPDCNSRIVKLALMIDYILAFSSIGVALGYVVSSGSSMGLLPVEGVASAGIGLVFFLLGCTTCATGTPYIVVHSLWHVASAYCSYVVGNFHLMIPSVVN